MKRTVAILICTVFCGLVAERAEAGETATGLVGRGNRLYSEKKYDKAELIYRDAQKLLPESPEINFNLGDVAYRKGNHDEAEEYYSKVLESADAGRELRKKALYNLGNVAFGKGDKLLDSDLQKALDSYRLSILRYQDVVSRDEFGRGEGRGKKERADRDARFNIEVARLRIKDILDKLKQEEERRKQQQEQQEEFIKKLREAIEKEQEIVNDTGAAEGRKKQGEDVSQSAEEIKKKQDENKKRTGELGAELQQLMDAAKAHAADETSAPVDEKAAAAQESLKEAEIEEGTALQHLDREALAEAKEREEAALQNLQDAFDKLTKQQQSQPQPGQKDQQDKREQENQGKSEQDGKEKESGKDQQEKARDQKKMTPQEAQEELAKLRKQASEMRKENLENFLRRDPYYRQPRREYEPVDKDW